MLTSYLRRKRVEALLQASPWAAMGRQERSADVGKVPAREMLSGLGVRLPEGM